MLLIRGTAHGGRHSAGVGTGCRTIFRAGKRESMGRTYPRQGWEAGAHSRHTGMGRSAGFRDTISANSFGVTSKGLLGTIPPSDFDVRENLSPRRRVTYELHYPTCETPLSDRIVAK